MLNTQKERLKKHLWISFQTSRQDNRQTLTQTKTLSPSWKGKSTLVMQGVKKSTAHWEELCRFECKLRAQHTYLRFSKMVQSPLGIFWITAQQKSPALQIWEDKWNCLEWLSEKRHCTLWSKRWHRFTKRFFKSRGVQGPPKIADTINSMINV